MNKIGLVILLFISFFVFSCNENTPLEPETTFFDIQGENGFVGTVNGTNAFIALLVAGDEAIVYVCNGEEEISEWFRGAINDPTNFSLTNSNGSEISAKFRGVSFEGEVTLRNDSTYSFISTTSNAENAGIIGVVGEEAIQDEVEGGWILNSEGEERGAFTIRSVFRTPPPRPKIRDIIDGTSNTILFGEIRYTIRFFFLALKLKRSASGSNPIIEKNLGSCTMNVLFDKFLI